VDGTAVASDQGITVRVLAAEAVADAVDPHPAAVALDREAAEAAIAATETRTVSLVSVDSSIRSYYIGAKGTKLWFSPLGGNSGGGGYYGGGAGGGSYGGSYGGSAAHSSNAPDWWGQ